MNFALKMRTPKAAYRRLAGETGIPVEWLEPNVYRNEDDTAWVFECDGGERQFKYDNPPKDENGKALKYLSEKGSIADINTPLCPNFVSYVRKVGDKISKGELKIEDTWLLITEGDKKAIVGCMHDLLTVSVHGVTRALTKGDRDLVPGLKDIIASGDPRYEVKNVYIAYDSDCAIKPQVAKATIELGLKLRDEYGCNVKIPVWDYMEDQKGMDDYIRKHGIEAFKEVLEKAYTLDAYIEKFDDTQKTKKQSIKKKTHAQIVEELSDFYGNRIRLNEMTNEVEKDGREYYLDSSFIHISQEAKVELTKTYAIDYLVEVARNNAYHPVVEYLNSVKDKAQNLDADTALSKIHKMLSEITGVTDKLHLTFITKTLVAAVNRVVRPGCFFKRVCVFYGQQDAGKSSFWRELAGDKFFNSSYKGTTDKDDLMALHSAWVNEIAEFDKVYRKTDVANLKAVISDPFDKVRLPYGRTIQTLHRRSILVASTNKQDILLDPTGHTRFWVVVIPGKIDFRSLLEYRDLIWACVYNLFNSGYSYELSDDEQVASAANNERFTSFDPLFDDVEHACTVVGWSKDGEEYVTLRDLYNYLYPESSGKALKQSDWKPIADILTRLGYTSGHKPRKDGEKVSAWKLEKKVENLTVPQYQNPETHTGQVVLSPGTAGTVGSETVPEKYQGDTKVVLPEVNSTSTVPLTVPPAVQGFQPLGTVGTAKSETFCENKKKEWRVNINQFASYAGELVQIVGGDGKRWQVEHRKPDGSFGGFTDKVPTAHLKHPDLATVNYWDNVSPIEDDKPVF